MTSPRRTRHRLVRSAFVLDPSNLGHRVVTGASFTFLGIALRTLITLGSMAILARLLTPADFGYVAMAAVITELAALFGGFGFGNILIQKKTINRLHLDTVFWASAGIGLLVGGAIFLMSFMAGWLFRDSLTGDLLKVMCLSFVFGGLTCVHEAILTRLMRFHTEFWIQISVMAVRSLVAIAFALLGFGVWSLVVGGVVGSIFAVVFYMLAVPYLPRLRFHGGLLKSTWKTSGSYFGNGLLYYINMNVDIFLIGRTLGATSLGYYQNARSLTDEVRGRIAMPLQRVLFPAFSALQADLGRLQTSVIRAGRLLAAIIFPIGIGLSAVANELVPVLYGEQWLEMIPILSFLGISAAVRGSTAIASPLFNSRNQVPLALKFNSITPRCRGVDRTTPWDQCGNLRRNARILLLFGLLSSGSGADRTSQQGRIDDSRLSRALIRHHVAGNLWATRLQPSVADQPARSPVISCGMRCCSLCPDVTHVLAQLFARLSPDSSEIQGFLIFRHDNDQLRSPTYRLAR